jgi:hypothetical protein
VWAQLSSWYKQTVYDPTASLSAERRGTLSLPDIESCYNTKEKYDARVSEAEGCRVRGVFYPGEDSHRLATHSTIRPTQLPGAMPHQRGNPIPGGAQCPGQERRSPAGQVD